MFFLPIVGSVIAGLVAVAIPTFMLWFPYISIFYWEGPSPWPTALSYSGEIYLFFLGFMSIWFGGVFGMNYTFTNMWWITNIKNKKLSFFGAAYGVVTFIFLISSIHVSFSGGYEGSFITGQLADPGLSYKTCIEFADSDPNKWTLCPSLVDFPSGVNTTLNNDQVNWPNDRGVGQRKYGVVQDRYLYAHHPSMNPSTATDLFMFVAVKTLDEREDLLQRTTQKLELPYYHDTRMAYIGDADFYTGDATTLDATAQYLLQEHPDPQLAISRLNAWTGVNAFISGATIYLMLGMYVMPIIAVIANPGKLSEWMDN